VTGAVTLGAVDTLCGAFTPDREAVWDHAIAASGIAVKVRRDPADAFCDPDAMVARMDDLGVDTALVYASDPHGAHGEAVAFHEVAASPAEAEALATAHPGRFLAWWCYDPTEGIAGVRRAAAMLDQPWVVGLYLHTHSFDRPFDHADHYPFYALCAERGLPVSMQAGTSGGLYPSACGQPIGIDRPALYFRDTTFVLSHTGWPWVEEAVAMALKFPNVLIGTGSLPPRHWAPSLHQFLRGPGRTKVVWATNIPTVGLRHSLGQVDELDLAPETRAALLGGTARARFTRLPQPPLAAPPAAPSMEVSR
jgi:uncharacterized protein